MDANNKSHTKCTEKYNKGSLLVFVISLVLAVLLSVKIAVVNRKAEAIEAKLEKRIQRIEDELKNTVQKTVEEYLQSNKIPATTKSRDRDRVILGKVFRIASNSTDVLGNILKLLIIFYQELTDL